MAPAGRSEGGVLAFSPKRKALDTAQKYVQKGAYDKALKEYLKHLRAEPSDTNARLKLGDLHLKLGDKPAAIEAYSQVAELFSKSGFDAKAVAIYKQILKIDGSYLRARTELGEHFQRMGLTTDALREFQAAVEICRKRELKREAFDLLKRVAALDPSNVPNRLSLADLMVKENLMDEAREEYLSLLDEVEGQKAHDLIARVAQRVMEVCPDVERGVCAFVRAKVALQQAEAAIQAASEALPRFPDSIPLREGAVEAYEATGDTNASQSVWREIAELYKQRGDHDQARDILQRHVPIEAFGDVETDSSPSILLSEEADHEIALELQEPGSEASPPEIELVDSAPIPAHSPPDPDDLLAEARVALEFGDPDNAREMARQVLERDPNSKAAQQILAEADQAAAASAPAAEHGQSDDRAASGDVQASFEDSLPDIELVLDDGDDDERFISIEPPNEVDLQKLDAAAGVLELDEPLHEPAAEKKSKPAASRSEPKAAAKASKKSEAQGESASWADQSKALAEKLEEAERLFKQGQLEEAERHYKQILERAPTHPQALLRLGELAEKQGADPSEVTSEELEEQLADTYVQEDAGGPQEIAAIPELELAGPEAEESGDAAAEEEIEFEVDLEPELEAAAEPPVEEPVAAEPAAVVRAAEDEAQEGGEDFSDLLEEEIEAEAEEAAEEVADDEAGFDLAAALEEEGRTGGALGSSGSGFEEVFKAFKQGIQEQVGADEADAHYDLAIAYKEMGLLEDAVEELEFVRGSETHRLEGLSLLATCKLELGRPQEAAGHLAEALAVADEGDPSAVALRYDLGEALQAAGKPSEALDAFKKVAARDGEFRDVRARLAELGGAGD